MRPFSKRYDITLIEIDNLSEDDSNKLKRKIYNKLNEFNQVSRRQSGRYDSFMENIDIFELVRERIIDDCDAYPEEDYPKFEFNYYWERDYIELFDIVEFWYDELSSGEKLDFQKAINDVFKGSNFPWRLMDGYIVKVDFSFIQREIIPSLIEEMSANGFGGALKEFAEAQSDLLAKEYKTSIHNACKSFESTLKIVLNQKKGTLKQLVDKATDNGLFNDLPEDMIKGFGDNAFSALGYIRNRLAWHGQGGSVIEINEEYAKLAINLAAVYNTFFMNKYSCEIKNEKSIRDNDEIMF